MAGIYPARSRQQRFLWYNLLAVNGVPREEGDIGHPWLTPGCSVEERVPRGRGSGQSKRKGMAMEDKTVERLGLEAVGRSGKRGRRRQQHERIMKELSVRGCLVMKRLKMDLLSRCATSVLLV